MGRLGFSLVFLAALFTSGCALLPDISHQPQFHNPFPQLHRIAILPFYNQSADPHVDGVAVAEAYYEELQQIRGFEILPVGVVVRHLEERKNQPTTGCEYQELARELCVDAVVVGSVTDFTPYYPP